MGFMNMIENIAQISGKFACKTFVDHNIQMIGVAIMKLLPAKGVKQELSRIPTKKAKNDFAISILKYV